MAVHVRHNSLYISLLSSVKQQREMTKFCVVWIIFKIYISNLMVCSTTSFEIVLTKGNKLNDLSVSRDSKVKYKVIFLIDVVLGVAVVVS